VMTITRCRRSSSSRCRRCSAHCSARCFLAICTNPLKVQREGLLAPALPIGVD
jgi:hypothetical protein